jgi:large subunit ribosomal protein L4
MTVLTFTKSGAKATTPAKLDKAVFGLEVRQHTLLKEAYLTVLSNKRSAAAKTKRRGQVRGGGIKPWRQKGTGRARVGSIRSPIWRGGGIIFGPTGEQNYTRVLPTAVKRQALRQALSLQAAANKLFIIETFETKEGKVKPTLDLLSKIGATGKTLIVVSEKDALVDKATRNLTNVHAVFVKYLNVRDLMDADSVVVSQKSLDIIHEWLGGAK